MVLLKADDIVDYFRAVIILTSDANNAFYECTSVTKLI
jgi:hypothetical protein